MSTIPDNNQSDNNRRTDDADQNGSIWGEAGSLGAENDVHQSYGSYISLLVEFNIVHLSQTPRRTFDLPNKNEILFCIRLKGRRSRRASRL